MSETVKIWLEKLGDPSAEEISLEIKEVKGTISNECLWERGYNGEESMNPHTENIATLTEYLNILEEMLKEKPKGRNDYEICC